jgi:hypothetical protein
MALHKSLRIAAVLGILIAALGGVARPTHAACTSPDGIAGGITWNGTDSVIWCDGSTWYSLKDAASGGGSASAAGSTGQVQFNGGSNAFAADSNLTWDNNNNRFGIGNATPLASLDVKAAAGQTSDLFGITLSNGDPLLSVAGAAPGSNTSGVVTIYDHGVGKSGDGAILSVHADDQSPYLAKFYNEMYSATDPVFTYYADNSGTMMQGTETARSLQFYTGGLNNVRMTIDASGNVGIGTTAPTGKLHVTTDAEGWQAYFGDGTTNNPYAGIWTGSGSGARPRVIFGAATTGTQVSLNNGGIDRLIVDVNGNVGIGTTSPGSLLTVGVNGTTTGRQIALASWLDVSSSGGGYGLLGGNVYLNSNTNAFTYANTHANIGAVGFTTNYPSWNHASVITSGTTASTAGSAFTPVSIATFKNDGTVGIGTTAPNERLSILSADNAFATDIFAVRSSNLTQGVALGYASMRSIGTNGNNSLYVDSQAGGHVVLQNSSGGNVGIGVVPAQKLHVKGAALLENGASATATVRNAGLHLWTDAAFGMELHSGQIGHSIGWATAIYGRATDTTAIRFGTYPGSSTAQSGFSEKMTLLGNGNLGIGATAPGGPLEIRAASNTTGMIRLNSAAAGQYRFTRYLSNNSVRWDVGVNEVAESGSNAGADFFFNRFSDAGAFIDTPLSISRATGNVTASGNVGAPSFSGSGASLTSLNASNLATGTVPTARMGSGTANNTTYLRGDGTWAAASAAAAGSGGQVQFNNGSNAFAGDTALFWDNTNKRLGVATASPTTKLHVVGGGRFTTTSGTALVVSSSGGTSAIGISGSASGGSSLNVGVYGSNGATGGRGVHGANAMASGYGVYAENVDNSGYGIYCSSSNASGCGGNQAWTNTSDVRLKRDIRDVDPSMGLNAIMRLRPVTYRWRTDDREASELGFIAQEVEAVLPQVVGSSPDAKIVNDDGSKQQISNVKSLSYATIVVPLVKAVQELKAANDNLRETVEAQGREIEALKAARP